MGLPLQGVPGPLALPVASSLPRWSQRGSHVHSAIHCVMTSSWFLFLLQPEPFNNPFNNGNWLCFADFSALY